MVFGFWGEMETLGGEPSKLGGEAFLENPLALQDSDCQLIIEITHSYPFFLEFATVLLEFTFCFFRFTQNSERNLQRSMHFCPQIKYAQTNAVIPTEMIIGAVHGQLKQ